MGEDGHRCRTGEDRISGLPDELLHGILLRVGSARAAGRTGVLSRRWRRVWAGLPELVLDSCPDALPPPASFLDTVDGALTAYSSPAAPAPALARLCIALPPSVDLRVPAECAAPWLRFAAARVAGDLILFVPPRPTSLPPEPDEEADDDVEEGEELEEVRAPRWEELELPAWGGAKTIRLSLQDAWHLRPPSAGGVFTALTSLMILFGRVKSGELASLVSTQCPCLRDLRLRVTLVDASDVSIRSDTLLSLWLCIWNSWRIEVVAASLEKLSMHYALQARISAPKLAELTWYGRSYHPQYHQFDEDVSRRLRLLEMDKFSAVSPFVQQFDEAEELKLIISIPRGTEGYESFLNATSRLPKGIKALILTIEWNKHSLAQAMMHLFRSCDSIKKVSMKPFHLFDEDSTQSSCPPSCPCRLAVNCIVDDIALSFLEVVEIDPLRSSHEELEFSEQLSRCCAASLKKLIITYNKKRSHAPQETKEVSEKIRGMYPPNVEVEFYVVRGGTPVRFDWRLVKNNLI